LGIAGCRDDSRLSPRHERSMGRSRNAGTNDVRRRRESSRKVAAGMDYNRPQNCLQGANSLVGSWLETVTFLPVGSRPELKGLVTFHHDGTLAAYDQGNVTLDPPTVFSAGTGAWTQLNRRRFAYTQLELISDLNGNLIGYLKVRGIYTLDSKNEYPGTSTAEILDTEGNVLVSVDVTNKGQRIGVELPP
jgi:hypothetical protein